MLRPIKNHRGYGYRIVKAMPGAYIIYLFLDGVSGERHPRIQSKFQDAVNIAKSTIDSKIELGYIVNKNGFSPDV